MSDLFRIALLCFIAAGVFFRSEWLVAESVPTPEPIALASVEPLADAEPAIEFRDKAEAEPKSVAPSCNCSEQCTCGCQSGETCECGSKSVAVASAVQAPIVSSGSDWRINGRAWTRSSLLSHLYFDDNHGTYPRGSLDHLTLDQLIAMHASDHESAATSRGVVSRAQSARMVYATGGCPTGGCPNR